LTEHVDYSQLNGFTNLGGDTSYIYATAAMPRQTVETYPGVIKVVNYDAFENAKFVILHETQHGAGVRDEYSANRKAIELLNRK
jgi:hypothetical protein